MLLKKMLRDMKLNKTQFISIFLMSFLAIFIYTGLGSESKGYEKTLKEYYEDTQLADIWLYSTNFTKQDLANVNTLDEVVLAMRRLTINASGQLMDTPDITLHFLEEELLSKPYLMEGNSFDLDSIDGIWLDNDFATKRNLRIGDTITVNCMGMELTQNIKGLVISPEYVYKENSQMVPDHYQQGFAYLSIEALTQLPIPKESIPFTEILLTVKEGVNLKNLEELLYQKLPEDTKTGSGGLSILLSRKQLVSNVVFNNEIQERKSMTTIFPIAFLSIALLTILTTMTRMVNKQRTQIGILKALGFHKGKITWHYVSYSIFLTGIGALLGAVLGPLLLPPMFHEPMKTTFTLPVWKSSFPYQTIYVMVITVLSAALITFLSCRKILHESPAGTLRPLAPKTSKQSLVEKTNFWRRSSFSTQWNFRDVRRSKGRSAMAIVGVVGCMGLLITAFGCLDAFDSILSIKYDQLEQYENQYRLEETATEEQIASVMNRVSGEAVMETMVELKSVTDKKSTTLRINDNVTLRSYLDMGWKKVDLPERGISISYKLAEKLGLSIGDNVEWHMYGDSRYVNSTVTMIYRDPSEQGAVMSKESFMSYGYEFKPTCILSDSELCTNLDGVASSLNIAKSRENIEQMLSTMYLLIGVLCVAAALLAVVVLYNLGVLSFSEKERELATLKVLGFQSNRIRKILLVQNTWLSLIGLLPGYLFGVVMLNAIMSSMGEEFDMRLSIDVSTILICVSITMLLAVVVNYLFSGKVKRIDMVSSLKGVE